MFDKYHVTNRGTNTYAYESINITTHLHLLREASSLTSIILMIIITSILSSTSLMSASATSSNFLTATPIKHLVIIFQENVSFDHYFATYTNIAYSIAAS